MGERKAELSQHLFYKKALHGGIWKQRNKEPKITKVQFILLWQVTQLNKITLD